ncbi:MAG: isocitrate lyase/phosphoenolpyruvate mutase family protein [Bacteroidetes bacterium]|nr:isocitrate lyase/phosphoenolpyruvate mutase family protein [Bacteroidota bacterium]
MTPISQFQAKNERIFHQLHDAGNLLILPNIWDPLGAALLENMGYPAVATSSSAMSLSNGYRDGEKLPFNELLHILKRITQSVKVPVSADVERAYAANHSVLKENIGQLIDTGIAGINYEDSKPGTTEMISIKEQCEKIKIIKETARQSGSSLFLNARIDVYIKGNHLSEEEKRTEVLQRGYAYKEAGADGLYPIFIKNKEHIEAISKETGLPINITLAPGIPDFNSLKSLGVSRVSLASGFFKNAIYAMKNIAGKLRNGEGVQEALQQTISSDYLNNLLSDSPAGDTLK